MLDELAKSRPVELLRLLVRVLPRGLESDRPSVIPPEHERHLYTPKAMSSLEELDRETGAHPTPPQVLDALEKVSLDLLLSDGKNGESARR